MDPTPRPGTSDLKDLPSLTTTPGAPALGNAKVRAPLLDDSSLEKSTGFAPQTWFPDVGVGGGQNATSVLETWRGAFSDSPPDLIPLPPFSPPRK